jgi:hypothetical protein
MKLAALFITFALPGYAQIYFDDSSAGTFKLGKGAWELVLRLCDY